MKTGRDLGLPEDNLFADAEVIYEYGPDQAIEDGMLVVVDPSLAQWFKRRVVITRHLHEELGKPSRGLEDYTGRLHDVLWMAYLRLLAARTVDDTNGTYGFKVLWGRGYKHLFIRLGDPITIGYPEDD